MSLSAQHTVPMSPFPGAGLRATVGALGVPSPRMPLLSSSTQDFRWQAESFEQVTGSQTCAHFVKFQTEGRPDPVPGPETIAIISMLHRGHGRELITLALEVSTSTVDSVAHAHGLTDVADRHFIAGRHAKAWSIEQYATLAQLWRSGVGAQAIAERLGRSKSSIWSKRRYLGLPKRDRVYTRVPRIVELTARQANNLLALDDPKRILTVREMQHLTDKQRCGRSYYVENAPDDLTMAFHRSRCELVWNYARYREVSLRVLSGQYMADIARDFGTTPSTIKSIANRVQLERRTQIKLVHHYDPELAQPNADRLNIHFRECNSIPNWWFWSPKRNGSITSRRYKATREYKDRIATA